MFTEDVSRIHVTFDMVVTGDAGSNSFTGPVVGESIVALMKLGVRYGSSVDH